MRSCLMTYNKAHFSLIGANDVSIGSTFQKTIFLSILRSGLFHVTISQCPQCSQEKVFNIYHEGGIAPRPPTNGSGSSARKLILTTGFVTGYQMTLIRADTRYTRTPLCRNFSNFSPCKSPAINACSRPSLALLNIKCMFACHQRPLLGLGTLISTLISLTSQICIADSAPDYTRLINTGRAGRLGCNCISHSGFSFMAAIIIPDGRSRYV